MKSSEYRTPTIFKEADNGISMKHPEYWPFAIDIGYSGVKLYAPNICACFPSYAKEIDESSFLGELATDDILYTDTTTGKTWIVGRAAQNMIQSGDTNDSIEALCGRNRYFTPMFQVISRVGMGIAMMNTINGKYHMTEGTVPFIQTGLPCQYLKSDTALLKEALAEHHEFMLRIGGQPARSFSFDVAMDNIKVMPQPMGAFISASTDSLWRQNVGRFQKANVLIIDPGFSTFDTFSVRGGTMDSHESWTDLGMSRVLKETSKQIFERYGTELPVANMQKALEEGVFKKVNRRERRTENVAFSDILEEQSRKVCNLALDRLFDMYNYFTDYRYLIITGGTGAAWVSWIISELKNINTLDIIAGNTPDNMPQYFANVRGYYSNLKSVLNFM